MPELTAKENIFLPMMIDKVKVDEEYFDKLTEKLGISERLTHYPSQLSGGQQQRVAIARALAAKPSIILADEPTGNLDSKTSMDVIALLKLTGKEFAQTIVMITHNEEIATMADQMIWIEDGRIFSAGVPDGANGVRRMLRNNNQAAVSRIYHRMLKQNKVRNVIVILAIVLTTFMFTAVFTLGFSIAKNLNQMQLRLEEQDLLYIWSIHLKVR